MEMYKQIVTQMFQKNMEFLILIDININWRLVLFTCLQKLCLK